ncbi:MAG TPA: hypothetical protein VNL77_23005 [Roseiflexaceae bacterium]|nr:hypothetical protein [Roseiflexaceae bacterium]
MFVRISHGRFNPASESDVQRIVEGQVIPVIQGLPGFQRYYGGVNRGAGTLVAVTVWDTEEHASFSRENLAGVMPALQAIGVTLEPPQIFEVTVEAKAALAAAG